MAESLSTLPHIVISFFLVFLLLLLLPSSSTYDHNNVLVTSMAEAHIQDHAAPAAAAETMEWAGSDSGAASIYSSYPFGYEEDGEEVGGGGGGEEDEDEMMGAMDSRKDTRRALFWHRIRYYISYAALSANRIPCPPRSGRSYYTHNCYRARGPVHPYSRSCSIITRCRS